MFINVEKETLTNDKEQVIIRPIHFKTFRQTQREIKLTGKEIDYVAFVELGSYERVLELLEHNAQVFTEYKFNQDYISKIGIP